MRETWKRRAILGSPNEIFGWKRGSREGLQAPSARGLGVLAVAVVGCNSHWGVLRGSKSPLPTELLHEHVCCFPRAELTRAQGH